MKRERPTVGECQKVFDKYNVEGTSHTATTSDLCSVILELEKKLDGIKDFCVVNHTHLEVSEEPIVSTRKLFEYLSDNES